jgi:hypothetical protein
MRDFNMILQYFITFIIYLLHAYKVSWDIFVECWWCELVQCGRDAAILCVHLEHSLRQWPSQRQQETGDNIIILSCWHEIHRNPVWCHLVSSQNVSENVGAQCAPLHRSASKAPPVVCWNSSADCWTLALRLEGTTTYTLEWNAIWKEYQGHYISLITSHYSNSLHHITSMCELTWDLNRFWNQPSLPQEEPFVFHLNILQRLAIALIYFDLLENAAPTLG